MTGDALRAHYVGDLAWNWLTARLMQADQGYLDLQVIAQFQTCAYLAPVDVNGASPLNAGQLICAGTTEIGRGPLNVLLGRDFATTLLALRPGTRGRCTERQISFHPFARLTIDADAVQAAPAVTEFDCDRARPLLKNYKLPAVPPGLDNSLFASVARRSIGVLANYLSEAPAPAQASVPGPDPVQAAAEVNTAVRELVGLGTGLTPAGDDFLAGIVLTLMCIRRHEVASSLGRTIVAVSASETNRISAAHLHAAAKGYCGETLAQVFKALADTDQAGLDSAVRDLLRIGHTSGRDTWCGVLFTISWLH